LTNTIPSGIVDESSEESLFEAKLLNVSAKDKVLKQSQNRVEFIPRRLLRSARNDKKGHAQSSTKLQAYLTVLKNVVK